MSGEAEIAAAAAAAGAAEPPAPNDRALADEPRNDIGNARRLIARHGHDLIHVDEAGWHRYDGRCWWPPLAKAAPEAVRLAQDTSEAILAEAGALRAELIPQARAAIQTVLDAGAKPGTPELVQAERELARAEARCDKHAGWSVASGNMARITSMLAAAAPLLRVGPRELDADPALFNVANGTLVLGPGRDGVVDGIRLRPQDRADRITRLSPVVYDPEATCPTFNAFFNQAQPDPAMRLFLQTWHGYCLTGDVSEQVIVLNHGTGSNGKSTFLGAMERAMGNYAVSVPIEAFLFNEHRRGGEATPEMIPLISARLALAAEPESSSRLSEAMAKRITGGEKMNVRRLFEGMIEIEPRFKLALSFNKQPRITGQDEGIWRRILLVPWTAYFPRAAQDLKLKDKLAAETAGILNWMLDGLRVWHERGLVIPPAILSATAQYRHESDPVGQFVAALVVERVDGWIGATRLYGVYMRWAKANGMRPVSSTAFGTQLADRGMPKAKIGTMRYVGIAFDDAALSELEGSTLQSGGLGGPAGPDPP